MSGENEEEIEKISGEIDLVIRHRIEAISRKRSLEADEATYLQDQFTHVENRTYLWATLTLDVIDKSLDGITRGSIRRTISTIPQTVNQAYNRILQRSTNPEKARLVLHAVTVAMRPLSLEEMSIIIAIENSHTTCESVMDELEPQRRFGGTLRDLCGLFVVVIDGKIYLLHQTAREFLVRERSETLLVGPPVAYQLGWMHSLHPQHSHRILAERCIWYLLLDFDGTRLPAFFDYSATHWPAHFREAGVQSEEAIVEWAEQLCGTNAQVQPWMWCEKIYEKDVLSLSLYPSPLFIASYFGLDLVVSRLLEAGASVKTREEDGSTALIAAASYGHDAVVERLLQKGYSRLAHM